MPSNASWFCLWTGTGNNHIWNIVTDILRTFTTIASPQVYGVLSVPCSVSVLVASLIFSPILAASLWSGSILGCIAGKSSQGTWQSLWRMMDVNLLHNFSSWCQPHFGGNLPWTLVLLPPPHCCRVLNHKCYSVTGQNLTRCCYHALPRISALPFLLAAVVTTVGAQAALAHLFRQSFLRDALLLKKR